jgi:hypothetical protein
LFELEYEKIKGLGELGVEFSKEDDDGSRVAKDFLEKLVKNIIKRSIKYYEATEDHVFTYREKQLHSVVCPSIADITDSYLIEHPLKRKRRGEKQAHHGNVDYCVRHRNTTFLLELKHTYFAYRNTNYPRKSIVEKFEDALDQLKKIPRNQYSTLLTSDFLLKVALETIVFYRSSKNKNLEDNLESAIFKQAFEKMLVSTGLSTKSNFQALWIINRKFVTPFPADKSNDIYPAVAFVGWISINVV